MNVDNPVFLASGQITCWYCPLKDLPLSACFHFGGTTGSCPTAATIQDAINLAKEYVNDI